MSVNRYNPYHNQPVARGQPAPYQTQTAVIPSAPASQRVLEPAVWQWVPDPADMKGPYRVLMTGLPTENVAKKEIIELFASHVTPNVLVDPIFDEGGFNGSCIFTLYTPEDVLKTYDQFEGKYFDDMSTQIKVEFLIRPGSRVPIKIARQIIHDDQIIAVAPVYPQAQTSAPGAYYGNGQNTAAVPPVGPSHAQQQTPVPAPTGPARGIPRGPTQSRSNGASANVPHSAPTTPRSGQHQQQNGTANPAKHNSNTNYNKNTSSATAGKSLLQRMNIGLAERISGAPVWTATPPKEPAAAAKKGKKQGVAGVGPARPNASITNQARRNMKPYAPFPANTPTQPKSQNVNTNQPKPKQQPKKKETQQEILDRELEAFQKRRGK